MSSILQYLVYSVLALLFSFGVLCWVMILVRRTRASALAQLPRGILLTLSICAVVAAGWAQKGGSRAPARSPTVPGETSGSDIHSDEESSACFLTNLCFSAMSACTNSVRLDLAWPDGFFSGGERLDIFATTNLVCAAVLLSEQDEWSNGWRWCAEQVVAAGSTNASLVIEVAGGEALPPALFFKAVLRTQPTDLRDSDGDGVPDLYEWFNGGGLNPYVADSECALRRVVDGTNITLAAALAASAPYDIVELDATQVHKVEGLGCRLPSHPVMITSSGGYAVVRSSQLCAFLLDSPTRGDTVFANLYLHLVAERGFQAGFWVGGNLPWSGTSASATFRNVYVRMPNPDVLYYGWHFYCANESACEINGCTVNAAGADQTWGIYAYESPPITVTNCSFVNFPSAANANAAYGVGVLSSLSNYGSMVSGTAVNISRCVFDDSFTNAVPYGRAEQGGNVFQLEVTDCLLPRTFAADPPPNSVTNLQTGTGQLTWSGVPRTGSMAATLGYGALLPYLAVGTQDTDGDGISDNDEINIYGTDPWLADSDWDGVGDYQELMVDSTNPTNPHSFVQTLVVSVTNTVQLTGVTNYVAWGYSATGWETNGQEVVVGACGTFTYTNATSSGAVYVKVYRDLNTNGVYDADLDILLVESIPRRSFASLHFSFGDVDKDGVEDHVERAEGTDPYDAKNFRIRKNLRFSNLDSVEGVTNYVVLCESLIGWTNLCAVGVFTNVWSYSVDKVVTSGILHALCWRDFNGDGIYDPTCDVLYDQFNLTSEDNGQEASFAVGDYDKDGVQDSFELEEGTDPRNDRSYCFNLSETFTDVFHTTNALSAEVYIGTNCLAGPFVMTTNTWTYSDHIVVSNRETIYVFFWDDMNSNGMRDIEEVSITITNKPSEVKGHEYVVTNRLSMGDFDFDNDGMLDSWELLYGLDPTDPSDASLDLDNDGFINLYEFWAGTSPTNTIENGCRTALYAASHGVDDRIQGTAHAVASPYYRQYSTFVENWSPGSSLSELSLNTNCWMYATDLSCLSVVGTTSPKYGCPLTAISPIHIIGATHVMASINSVVVFRLYTGELLQRRLIATETITGIAENDIFVGILDSALPESIHPVRFLPKEYQRYIGNGNHLPWIRIGNNKTCSIHDIRVLSPCDGSRTMTRLYPLALTTMRRSYARGPWAFDSGHPIFLLVGNELVYLCPAKGFYPDNLATGYLCTPYLDLIQRSMDNLSDSLGCGRYELRCFSFEGYQCLQKYGGL